VSQLDPVALTSSTLEHLHISFSEFLPKEALSLFLGKRLLEQGVIDMTLALRRKDQQLYEKAQEMR
jgi:hypothetical protein